MDPENVILFRRKAEQELEKADTYLSLAASEERDLTAQEQTEFETCKSNAERFSKMAEQCASIAQRRAEMSRIEQPVSTPTPNGPIAAGMDAKDKQKFSLARACWAIGSGDWSQAGFEREVFQTMEHKRLQFTAGSTDSGSMGYLIPAEQMLDLIPMLEAETAVLRLGATRLDGLSAFPVTFPKETTTPDVAAVALDNDEITETEGVIGQMSLSPNKFGAIIPLSNTLLRFANPKADEFVNRTLMSAAARKIDYYALWGSGANNQPSGLLPAGTYASASINKFVIGDNGGALTYPIITRCRREVNSDNAPADTRGWCFNSLVEDKIANIVDDNNRPLFGWNPSGAVPENGLLGKQYAVTNIIPSNIAKGTSTTLSALFYGAWREMVIALWGNLELAASPHAYDAFKKDQTYIRIIGYMDTDVFHNESFCVVADVETSG